MTDRVVTPSESTHQGAQGAAEIIRAAIDPYVTINQRLGEAYAGAMAENRDLSERIAQLSEEVGRLRGIEEQAAQQLEIIKGQAESLEAYGRLRGEWSERAHAERRRAEEAEARAAEAERRLKQPWWRRILG